MEATKQTKMTKEDLHLSWKDKLNIIRDNRYFLMLFPIVIDCFNHCRHTVFISLEIYDTNNLLTTATDVAHSHLTFVVTTT